MNHPPPAKPIPVTPRRKVPPRAQLVRLSVTASRTPITVRPAALNEVLATVIFRREAALELGQGARNVWSGHGLDSPECTRSKYVVVS